MKNNNKNLKLSLKPTKLSVGLSVLMSCLASMSCVMYTPDALSQEAAPGKYIYKWKDAKGVYHYSDRQEAAHKGEVQVLSNKNATLREVVERELTEEELAGKAAKDAVSKQDDDKVAKATEATRRRDNALVTTYSGVSDLERVRDFELGQIERSMKNDRQYAEDLKKKLSELEGQRDSTGKKPELQIGQVSRELSDVEKQLTKNQELYNSRNKKFKEDKIRLEELLAGKAAPQVPAAK